MTSDKLKRLTRETIAPRQHCAKCKRSVVTIRGCFIEHHTRSGIRCFNSGQRAN